jgi:Fe/S biogenesis protein NfuA
MVTFTEEAKSQVMAAVQDREGGKVMLRLEARNIGGFDFSYAMRLIGPDEKTAEDRTFDGGGFEVVVDPESAGYLKGASVDYESGALQSGFRFDNPNRPPIPGLGETREDDLTGPLAERVKALFENELNPAVAGHGGVIRLLAVRDNKVYVAFGGGCHGCGMVNVTLKQGVEARLKEAIPEIEEVVDVTNHASGDTPYYK